MPGNRRAAGGTRQLPGIGRTELAPMLKVVSEIANRVYVNQPMHCEPAPDEVSAALEKSRTCLIGQHQKAMAKQP
jgi:hypothetical protein